MNQRKGKGDAHKNGKVKKTVEKKSIEPICVTDFNWLIAPGVMTMVLIFQVFLYRILNDNMLVNMPFWCFFLWIWYTRPNVTEEEVVHSVDYVTMSLFVQIWIVYGVAMQSIPVFSVYLVRLFGIFMMCAVGYSFDDLTVFRTSMKKNIFIATILTFMILLRSPDAAAHTSSPFVMLWRVMFYCASFILSDVYRKMGITVHIYSNRLAEASKIRDFQTLWILFCWQYSAMVGSLIEVGVLIWQVWSVIFRLRQQEEDDEINV